MTENNSRINIVCLYLFGISVQEMVLHSKAFSEFCSTDVWGKPKDMSLHNYA